MRTLLLSLLLALLPLQPAVAETQLLTYGDTILAAITDDTPGGQFQFEGRAGDLVSIEVLPIGPALDLLVGVLGEMQTDVASQTASTVLTPRDAAVHILLPEDGLYTIVVHSENETQGQYVLRLQAVATTEGGTLFTEPTQSTIATAPSAIRYQLPLTDTAEQTVFMRGQRYSEYRLQIVDESGGEYGRVTGSGVLAVTAPLYPDPLWAVVTRLSEGVDEQITVWISDDLLSIN